MSSVGFTSNGKNIELAKLREAYDSLKNMVRGIVRSGVHRRNRFWYAADERKCTEFAEWMFAIFETPDAKMIAENAPSL